MNSVGMDSVNWQILALLQENARISFSEIGRRVGLTSTAVAERVRRLEDARIIRGYRVDVGADQLGYGLTVIIRVSVRNGASAQFVRLVDGMPEILECHRVTGDDSYVLTALATSVHHLEQMLLRIRAIGQPATSVILSTVIQHPVVRPAQTDPGLNGDGPGPVKRTSEYTLRSA